MVCKKAFFFQIGGWNLIYIGGDCGETYNNNSKTHISALPPSVATLLLYRTWYIHITSVHLILLKSVTVVGFLVKLLYCRSDFL